MCDLQRIYEIITTFQYINCFPDGKCLQSVRKGLMNPRNQYNLVLVLLISFDVRLMSC